jgi:phosphatidylinositol alpha-mannosyltransferase
VRIALVSPYSWTYPGGVTRHIDALAAELRRGGHDARILSPYDPDDARSRRRHRGARPESRALPEDFVSLGRTLGFPANGAVSNLAVGQEALLALRAELRCAYDVVHVHEPVAPLVCWDALATARAPLVGTFHTYSVNAITNGIAGLLGARRRMNRLHARIAVSEAAAWTARRFFGGRYRIVPNGVELPPAVPGGPRAAGEPLRILFVGQAVERKGLPILLRAFEALREHVPAELTLVGASHDEVAHMMLDDRRVTVLGKVSDAEKLAQLQRAHVLCAPSLHGESFGMVLTEAFAAGVPAVAADIPGYRDVARHGQDSLLVAPGEPLALAEALRELALDEPRRRAMADTAAERARRFAWSRVAGEVVEAYEQAIAVPVPTGRSRVAAVRYGVLPADLQPPVPARRLAALEPAPPVSLRRQLLRAGWRTALTLATLAYVALAWLALDRIGLPKIAASLLASRPSYMLGGLALMGAAMAARGLAWHAILRAAPALAHVRRVDALQGTFVGVLMSATLPARLGEPARALVMARRLGRARETLPVVLGAVVSQTLINLLALGLLGTIVFSSVNPIAGHHHVLVLMALAPIAALALVAVGPALVPRSPVSRWSRLERLLARLRATLVRARDGLGVFREPRRAAEATATQLLAWGLQLMSCYLLLMALGLSGQVGLAGAAAVLFAVNMTAVIPATPSNVGVFQIAVVAVLHGAFHVGIPAALAYGLVLQAVEVSIAVLIGTPALVREGLSWRELRRRAMHAAPVQLGPRAPERATAVLKP